MNNHIVERIRQELINSVNCVPLIRARHNVYDKVWLIRNNKTYEVIIYSVVETMSHDKQHLELTYSVVDGLLGAGIGNNAAVFVNKNLLFKTKKELIESL